MLTYAICVAAAAGLVLIPRALLQLIILCVQVRAGIVLALGNHFPSALLLNDKELMGASSTSTSLGITGGELPTRDPCFQLPSCAPDFQLDWRLSVAILKR